jgi:hypothetical protein
MIYEGGQQNKKGRENNPKDKEKPEPRKANRFKVLRRRKKKGGKNWENEKKTYSVIFNMTERKIQEKRREEKKRPINCNKVDRKASQTWDGPADPPPSTRVPSTMSTSPSKHACNKKGVTRYGGCGGAVVGWMRGLVERLIGS